MKDSKKGWSKVHEGLQLPKVKNLVTRAIQDKTEKDLFDFDDHFENVSRDWRNLTLQGRDDFK